MAKGQQETAFWGPEVRQAWIWGAGQGRLRASRQGCRHQGASLLPIPTHKGAARWDQSCSGLGRHRSQDTLSPMVLHLQAAPE